MSRLGVSYLNHWGKHLKTHHIARDHWPPTNEAVAHASAYVPDASVPESVRVLDMWALRSKSQAAAYRHYVVYLAHRNDDPHDFRYKFEPIHSQRVGLYYLEWEREARKVEIILWGSLTVGFIQMGHKSLLYYWALVPPPSFFPHHTYNLQLAQRSFIWFSSSISCFSCSYKKLTQNIRAKFEFAFF